ncbi:MAG: hypothetical protein ABI844_09295 [Saprospiraceae bacterium]
MKNKPLVLIAITAFSMAFKSNTLDKWPPKGRIFNIEKDLLLVQFDCKTDVDDLQSAAALATLLADSKFSKIQFHAVAGTYGIQEGLYVPPNELFQLAFGNNWTDANANLKDALDQVKAIIKSTFSNQGEVWIAEAGQSDFTASLIKSVQSDFPDINISPRIHVIQHSDWNEKATSSENLQFVKNHSDYIRIPDGNIVGNGSPGFRSLEYIDLKNTFTNFKLIKIWQLSIDLSNQYNGKEGRYLNEAIMAGGFDFSDLSEVCWILGLAEMKDTEQFFNAYLK